MIPEPLQWFDRKKNAIKTRCKLKEGDKFHTLCDDCSASWVVKDGRAHPIKTNTIVNGRLKTHESPVIDPVDIQYEGLPPHAGIEIFSSISLLGKENINQNTISNTSQDDKYKKLFELSANTIFARNSIVNASSENEFLFFIKGPFEDLDDKDFIDPYVENIDYDSREGKTYKTIVSCGGRIRYGSETDSLLPSNLYEIAASGGWSGDDMEFQEIYCGGADILPDYTCLKLADCLLNALGKSTNDFHLKNRIVSRELVWRSLIILRSGPTLMPW
jgi:hypothetical protein